MSSDLHQFILQFKMNSFSCSSDVLLSFSSSSSCIIIGTDEDLSLRIESSAIGNLRGVSTKLHFKSCPFFPEKIPDIRNASPNQSSEQAPFMSEIVSLFDPQVRLTTLTAFEKR